MSKHFVRCWLAGIGVAGAIIVASATAAAANPVPVGVRGAEGFDLYANSVTVTRSGSEKHVTLRALVGQPLSEYTVTVDRSAVERFAEVRKPEGNEYGSCTEDDAILTCKVDGARRPDLLTLPVVPLAGAKAGQQGQLRFTVSTSDSGTDDFRSTITVGEGVDLVSEPGLGLSGRPGDTVKAPLSVGNQSEQTASGLVLLVYGNYGLTPSKRYENCEYGNTGPNRYMPNLFACSFDRSLAPGEAARVDAGFGFTVPSDAWAPDLQNGFAAWLTAADWQEVRHEFDLGGKGGDGVLKLEPTSMPQNLSSHGTQTDVDPSNNETWVRLTVEGDQQADVVANGATVTGEVGENVPVTVGFTNNGPAAVGVAGTESLPTMALVTLPEDTTVVETPEYCADYDEVFGHGDNRGNPDFACSLPGPLGKGKTAAFPFSLRIDKAGPQQGIVRLYHGGSDEGYNEDLHPANDEAKILINPAAGDGQGGGQGDDGPSLPITGSSTSLIIGIGGLLLVAGAGGFLAARRRRTRFVA
ncbi:LPXTG cell wall anchor domain-containing protein [Micromonospora avicenniae]|uniref:LPXTG-motif cell wall anchor domain-containing protein n=1 Tax=Micromonospora avicenniae TaxID=1198245 RepID=A0A1N7E1Z5_9ACTN|nr:LPXTG cell wall anchor domain-containing protein [Micromonospora avicenniae]SIR82066.1 LPXTG-motif cell wall anchor domain-containing protein [Micromonospora avicenniae]